VPDETVRAYAFKEPGPHNTEKTLKAAIERAQELGIRYIVVASVGGNTALQAKSLYEQLKYQGKLIVVTQHAGWAEAGRLQLGEETRKRLRETGCEVVTSTHALSGISRSFRQEFGGIDLPEVVAEAFRRFSQGVKASIESAIMAADAGVVPIDEDIVAVAGSGEGADSALVIRTASQNRFFDLKVREVIAMPR
jgi:hypothetical protein